MQIRSAPTAAIQNGTRGTQMVLDQPPPGRQDQEVEGQEVDAEHRRGGRRQASSHGCTRRRDEHTTDAVRRFRSVRRRAPTANNQLDGAWVGWSWRCWETWRNGVVEQLGKPVGEGNRSTSRSVEALRVEDAPAGSVATPPTTMTGPVALVEGLPTLCGEQV